MLALKNGQNAPFYYSIRPKNLAEIPCFDVFLCILCTGVCCEKSAFLPHFSFFCCYKTFWMEQTEGLDSPKAAFARTKGFHPMTNG